MKKVKAGVIGTGHLGKLHTKFLKLDENCDLIGVYDMDYAKASAVAAEFHTKAFKNLDELISLTDALSVVASTSAHHK
ncbi:MAG: Gfo/Idh/MocA family oxidoreductase, partial [bacterium]